MPPLIDTPVARADLHAKKKGCNRETWRYKLYAVVYSLLMFLQVFLCLVSITLTKFHLKGIYRPKVITQLREADVIIFSGGEGVKEGSSYVPYDTYIRRKPALLMYHIIYWWLILFSRMCTIVIIRKIFKKPIVVFPNSIGPFRTLFGRFMAKIILRNVNILLVRDFKSSELLNDMNIPHSVTTDVALLFNADQVKSTKLSTTRLVGVSPGILDHSFPDNLKRRYILAHSKVLDHLAEDGFNIIFLPSCLSGLKHDDLEVCRSILRNMTNKNKTRIIKVKTADEFKYLLDQLDLLISTRMHPCILACTNNVPFVSILYDHKQESLLEFLGLENCAVDINSISYDNLLSATMFVWNNKEKIKRLLASKVPTLQDDVRTKIRQAILKFLN
jgi:polysaccharide pyruvyl transferase WcaK-like protein